MEKPLETEDGVRMAHYARVLLDSNGSKRSMHDRKFHLFVNTVKYRCILKQTNSQ